MIEQNSYDYLYDKICSFIFILETKITIYNIIHLYYIGTYIIHN